MAEQKGNGVIQRMSHYRPTPMLVTQPYHYNSRQLLSRSSSRSTVDHETSHVLQSSLGSLPTSAWRETSQLICGCFRRSKDNIKELSQCMIVGYASHSPIP